MRNSDWGRALCCAESQYDIILQKDCVNGLADTLVHPEYCLTAPSR